MEDKKDTVLEQWQTCVDMANSVSQRRDTMNNLFVTLNIAMVAAFSIVWDIKSILISCAGIVICIVWLVSINNYRLLNKAKFEVINEMEKKLQMQPFADEWNKLKENKNYRDSTTIEQILPLMFIILYVVGVIMIFVMKGKGEA